MEGSPLMVHDDGKQERCFAHVADVVGAVTTLMQHEPAFGRIYNIGSDQPISILELARRVIAMVNPAATIQYQSYAQAYDQDFEDIRRRVPDLTRIRETIGYRPSQSLDDMIRDVWQDQLRRGSAPTRNEKSP